MHFTACSAVLCIESKFRMGTFGKDMISTDFLSTIDFTMTIRVGTLVAVHFRDIVSSANNLMPHHHYPSSFIRTELPPPFSTVDTENMSAGFCFAINADHF